MRAVAGILVLWSAVAVAQTESRFEVASVRPSSDQVTQYTAGAHIDGAQVRITGFSLKQYIGMAYGLRPQQIVAPDWMAQTRFDVAAKIPDDGSPSQVPLMLRALLAERFALKFHRETREVPVYALVVSKEGFKLQPLPEAAADSAGKPPAVNVTAGGNGSGAGADLGNGSSFAVGNNQLEMKKMTLAAVAELLTRFGDRPVVDETGIAGAFDITLEMSNEEYTAALIRGAVVNGAVVPPQALRLLDGAPADPFSNALHTIGLTLESRKAPLDFVVIDSALKTPTEN